jgi:hypothetical protein
MQINTNDGPMDLQLKRYGNGNLAVLLYTLEGEPYAKLSTNVEGVEIGQYEFFVPRHNLDDDFLRSLLKTGKFEQTNKSVAINYVTMPLWVFKP